MPFRHLTVLASSLLLLIFALIVGLIWRQDDQALESQLAHDANRLQTGFEVSVANMEQEMLALATLFAIDPEVGELFAQGKDAVAAEGGGAGGERAARARAALLARVEPQWREMQRQFGLRQLQFHLGSGSISFLRVHAPAHSGDRTDELRHMIADSNRDRRPHSGFEIGRLYSGIRGVVPVHVAGTAGFIGVVEAGTTFGAQLASLDRQLGAGFAVLLNNRSVANAQSPNFRKPDGSLAGKICDCYVEASSRKDVETWIETTAAVPGQASATWLEQHQGKNYHLLRFPLRDYRGKLDAQRPPVGSVLVWRDVSPLITRHETAQRAMLITAVLAYLSTQLLLLLLLRHFHQRIRRKAALLHASETRFQRLLMALGDGVVGVDMQGRATFANPAALAMLGYREADVIGQDQHALFHHHRPDGSEYPTADCPVCRTRRDDQARHEELEWFIRKDGGIFPVALTVTPLAPDGGQAGSVMVFQDISERNEKDKQLYRLATTDALTGIRNRRYFLEQLELELARGRRHGKPTALMMLDLDHFKRINDSHGHAVGDCVLRHFADIVQQTLRRVDVFGRLGGEEFAILLPDTDAASAQDIAERLRQDVATSAADTEAGRIDYSVSIGVTEFAPGDRGADSVLARADQALYRAKHGGRNRVEIEPAAKAAE